LRRQKLTPYLVAFFLLISALSVSAQSVQSTQYDKYGFDAKARESLEPKADTKSLIEKILDSPSALVTIVKDILRTGVVWLESYHVYDKVLHFYDTLTEKGIYLYQTSFGDRHADPPGVESTYGIYPAKTVTSSDGTFKPLNIQYIKEFEFDNDAFMSALRTQSWVQYGHLASKDFGSQITLRDILGTSNYFKATARYHDNPQEDFFGQGPNTSLGDGAAFGIEEFSGTISLGREFMNSWTVEAGLTFSTSDVTDAKDNKKLPIHAYPGLHGFSGADLVGLGLSLEHDTRDNETNPRIGGFQRIKMGYYEGVNGDEFGYTKLRLDAAEYVPIGQILKFLYWDSVLAFRVAGELNNDLNGDKIPFFDLARLGGPETLRGYQYNRFFDENSLFYSVEYRYNIWGMKNFKADATLFFDCGWVFDEVSEFELEKFQENYGIGFRFLLPRMTIALEAARSSDGTEVYFKVNPIF
jgi:hypothetical protein